MGSIVILGIRTLLQPLEWQGPVITMLPPSLQEYLDSPVPIILGINTPNFPNCQFHSEHLIVDLDTHQHQIPERLISDPHNKILIHQLTQIETNTVQAEISTT